MRRSWEIACRLAGHIMWLDLNSRSAVNRQVRLAFLKLLLDVRYGAVTTHRLMRFLLGFSFMGNIKQEEGSASNSERKCEMHYSQKPRESLRC